ncbi:hypothetical protein CPHO_10415 [Corynebacterium phocae]|uniref:Bacterial Ig-like domain-containing protein n=1 Tax=Corynebacterium phocae TaxID=161895 RepID=A0A1L7D4Y7_9CORY|nr:Ig-like domain repeat protein [Corynebacterium phocae]APT93236.1 hypothetical protein CPHO_10415 [Corynebacterium phocae]KAA8721553.1 Ig-like domain repeat protein [Corynebacterium phocae]
MKLSRSAIALLALTSTAFATITVPSATARPVMGNQVAAFEQHQKVGVQAITVVDHDSVFPGSQFKVKVLFAQDPDPRNFANVTKGVYPKAAGVGMDKALWDAIDHDSATVKQYATAAEVKANFTEKELAQLPAPIRSAIDNDSWQLKDRNRQDLSKVAFEDYFGWKYAVVADPNYTSDDDGLGTDGLIALEFTFQVGNDLNAQDGLHVGADFYAPTSGGIIRGDGGNWKNQLAPVTVKVRKEADVEMLTRAGDYKVGDKVTLTARVTPSQYQGNVTFNVGGQIINATINNQTATAEYTMTEETVNVRAQITGNDEFSGAISDYVRLAPKATEVPTPSSAPKPSPDAPAPEPSPAPAPSPAPSNPQTSEPETSKPQTSAPETSKPSTPPPAADEPESSSVKDYWWAIVLGILGLLGIAGGHAWINGLIPGLPRP